ncbi:MAG: hypothetical protein HQL73_05300 [Magnetococcales bacterium]|nr:hypothetical protein [Magnetococcales bacterium]
MRKPVPFILAIFLFLSARYAHADLVVLIHGYLGSAYSWQTSGIVATLESKNIPLGGILSPAPPWILPSYHRVPNFSKAVHTVYLAQLPSLAPIGIQSLALEDQLIPLGRKHPRESFILVGHSVGGVVARMALVRGRLPPVKALITIATPHLGTPRAEQALDAISDPWPVETIKEFFVGGPYPLLQESRGILFDLIRPVPGTLLFALNNSLHPKIRYISMVRSQPFPFGAPGYDTLVPAFSQNMNHVPALAGQSQVIMAPGNHPLHPGDGMILDQIVHQLTDSSFSQPTGRP